MEHDLCDRGLRGPLRRGRDHERLKNTHTLTELIGSLKLGNVWSFAQLIQRVPTISCTKTHTMPKVRLPISSAH